MCWLEQVGSPHNKDNVHGGGSAAEGERSSGCKPGLLEDLPFCRITTSKLAPSRCLYSLSFGHSRTVPTPVLQVCFLQPCRWTRSWGMECGEDSSAERKGAESCNGNDARTERRRPTCPAYAPWERRAQELNVNSWWHPLGRTSVFDLETIS